MKKFNINNYVFFKPTEKGLHLMVDDYNKIAFEMRIPPVTLGYYKSNLDERGYYKMQMWLFMRLFGGDNTGLGIGNLFRTEICFNEEDLEEVENG